MGDLAVLLSVQYVLTVRIVGQGIGEGKVEKGGPEGSALPFDLDGSGSSGRANQKHIPRPTAKLRVVRVFHLRTVSCVSQVCAPTLGYPSGSVGRAFGSIARYFSRACNGPIKI